MNIILCNVNFGRTNPKSPMYSSNHSSDVTIPFAAHTRFLGRNPHSIDAVMREAWRQPSCRRALESAELIINLGIDRNHHPHRISVDAAIGFA